ncbi:hypothetical protein VP1G_08210 [Cytospora mali]|uniref:Proline dehydrogenase n=1 Tax=Cytospora mali TaxID=578113 RepID=A0A194VAG3_CYTMA|nr:hypothetical protein VP1G_08210 [Valsa mali var. pyri (nom. inval.)]
MGYSGVILCYGKEIILHDPSSSDGSLSTSGSDMGTSAEEQIAQWRDGQLETLKYISAGDFIGIKYTGAGPEVVNALAEGRDLPAQVLEAMDIICKQAAAQGSSIWIDAEQQALQPTIDAWTIDLMRYYNRDGTALISNTIQAYLKGARRSVENHLHIAQREGWSLGIKLVRGAYIEKEVRSLIHDTKEDTDNSYNEIVRDLLCKSWPGFEGESFPDTHLFLAGHNSESIRMACETVRTQVKSGKKVGVLRFGQLQGMADEVSCKLLQQGEEARNCDGLSEDEAEIQRQMIPMAYKCLTWGSVQECLQFLLRRAIENRGATERMRAAFPELKAELRRRMLV